ncbi:MAG: hypothetical protein LBD24_06750 [Spirochaetaceae bacterium]|nr:hypothetical protein [Spirochaetaceae bacterium]
MEQPETARERSRAWAVPPAPPADKVLHHSETTGGHAVPPAAGGVLHRFEATGGHTETVGDGCGMCAGHL